MACLWHRYNKNIFIKATQQKIIIIQQSSNWKRIYLSYQPNLTSLVCYMHAYIQKSHSLLAEDIRCLITNSIEVFWILENG